MHSALATPDPHWLRCEQLFIQHSSVIGSRPEWETLMCSPQKEDTEHVWAGRGGLSAGAAWAGPPSQLLGAPGPLGPLWANAASGSLSSCLLTLGNSSCIAVELRLGLGDRSLKRLQKPGFSSVGFAAVLVPPG